MGMRITTGMAMNTYRYNLQNSTGTLNKAMNKILSQRNFDSFAEDPASAIQAWRVRRSMTDTACYQKNNDDTYTRFNIAWVTMGNVNNEIIDPGGRGADIYAATDSTAGARTELGKVLSESAESIIHDMNSAKSGENFVFSGDDELNAPFSWNDDHTILYYRGVNVNAGGVKSPAEDYPEWVPVDTDPVTGEKTPKDAASVTLPIDGMPTDGENALEQAWVDYYNGVAGAEKPSEDPYAAAGAAADPADDYGITQRMYDIAHGKAVAPPAGAIEQAWAEYRMDQADAQKLQEMSEEEANVDLGMGLLEDENDKLISGTYFNRSLPGINMLGFGIDEDGDPKNVCMIMKRLGEIYSSCDPETGAYPDGDDTEAMRLMDKLKAARDYTTGTYVDITTKSSFLQQNESRLDMQGDYLNEQLASLEDIDPADAIKDFSYDYYCYSAALKIGTQLLSQSLIDYMS